METAKQNTQQNIEENDALKQFMGLLNRQGMGEQSQDFMELFQYVAGMQLQLAVMTDELQGVKEQLSQLRENQPKTVTESLVDKVTHLQEKEYLYSIFYNMQKVYWRNIYDKLNSL